MSSRADGSARVLHALLAAATAAAAATCNARETTAPAPSGPARLVLVAGDGQTGTVGAALSAALVVKVTDVRGIGVGGATVSWSATAGGGAISDSAVETDASGSASVGWTLGTSAGVNRASAAVARVADTVAFTAMATPGPARRLAFISQPSSIAAETTMSAVPRVMELDAYGNAVTAGPDVTLTITAGTGTAGAVLGGITTVTPVAGIAAFPALTVDRLGANYTLTASAAGLASVTSAPFSVSGSRLVFTVQPLDAVAGTSTGPGVRVEAQDATGNTDPNLAEGVALGIAPGTGAQGATIQSLSWVPAVHGVAVFPAPVIDLAASGYRLTATANNLRPATSATFNIVAGPPARLTFVLQPSELIVDSAAPQFLVAATDSFGNTTTVAGVPITVALTAGAGTPGAALVGTLTQPTSGGVAAFGDLRLDSVGVGYTLTATSTALTPAVSKPFTVGHAAVGVSAGSNHSCALTPAGAAFCWGRNQSGQLGDGTTVDRTAPVRVAGGLVFTLLVAGGSHTCGLVASGAAWCWGSNGSGELGTGDASSHDTPQPVSGAPAFVQLAAGESHTCALTSAGAAWCWGNNPAGLLGVGDTLSHPVPAPVAGGVALASLTAGAGFTCGTASDGGAWCWGANDAGELGTADTLPRLQPARVASFTDRITSLAAGGTHTCAATTGLAVWCWGDGSRGQLGDELTTNRNIPTAVSGQTLLIGVGQLSLGASHSCMQYAPPICWGSNESGQIGNGGTADVLWPVSTVAPYAAYSAVAAGGDHTCALKGTGQIYCWGSNGYGELGDGTTVTRRSPVRVLTF